MNLWTKIICVYFLASISKNKLTAIREHYKQSPGELTPRKLKSGGRKNNTKSLSFEDTELVVKFIKQYAEDHALSLPGRVPGFKRDDIQVLPSSSPKSQIYRHYAESAEIAGIYLWHFKCVLWSSFLCIISWLFFSLSFFACHLLLTTLSKMKITSESVTKAWLIMTGEKCML